MSTAIESGIVGLIEQAGARPRGNRHDCPKCGGLRTITHSEKAFYCHKCHWKGNVTTLEKELGIYRRLPSAEYREQCRRRERASKAARTLYAKVHQRQLDLREELRLLGRAELLAHEQGADDPKAWDTLAVVYQSRPPIEAALDTLENSTAAELIRFLDSTAASIVERPGAFVNAHGVEVSDDDIPF